jgi:hypothetical protein
MTILDEYYAKDSKHVYFAGNEVVGADAASFRVTGPWTGADTNRSYKLGKPVRVAGDN